ncbi:hypothetical protein NOF04DRAFT_1311570 [Fusarium oxysporum II5]|nr:hypothetical protein DER44DRAFT_777069 [Fusarium oxysporum]KAK2135160.1 hypothetical protein NOF04DRAFT_1311570 [Fusarium oxysporum II5]
MNRWLFFTSLQRPAFSRPGVVSVSTDLKVLYIYSAREFRGPPVWLHSTMKDKHQRPLPISANSFQMGIDST